MTPEYEEICVMPLYGKPSPERVRVYAAHGQPVVMSVSNVERKLERRELSDLVDALCEAAKRSEA